MLVLNRIKKMIKMIGIPKTRKIAKAYERTVETRVRVKKLEVKRPTAQKARAVTARINVAMRISSGSKPPSRKAGLCNGSDVNNNRNMNTRPERYFPMTSERGLSSVTRNKS